MNEGKEERVQIDSFLTPSKDKINHHINDKNSVREGGEKDKMKDKNGTGRKMMQEIRD